MRRTDKWRETRTREVSPGKIEEGRMEWAASVLHDRFINLYCLVVTLRRKITLLTVRVIRRGSISVLTRRPVINLRNIRSFVRGGCQARVTMMFVRVVGSAGDVARRYVAGQPLAVFDYGHVVSLSATRRESDDALLQP